MKTKYKYSIDEDDFYEIESTWTEENLEYLAEDCAEDYHSNHDGWESHWPLRITIARLDETILGKFEVELYHQPEFQATKLDK